MFTNTIHTLNNIKLCGRIFAAYQKEKIDYALENKTPKAIFSNITKNIGIHLEPIFIKNAGNIILEKTHLTLHIDLNHSVNYNKILKYNINTGLKNHEDC